MCSIGQKNDKSVVELESSTSETKVYQDTINRFEEFQMTQPQATRTIIDTHRHIFGPKLRQKLVENIGFDDSKPLPQVFGDEMFFYRESVDVDYSMEIQRKSGVTLCVNSYGGEVEMFAQHVIKAPSIRSNS